MPRRPRPRRRAAVLVESLLAVTVFALVITASVQFLAVTTTEATIVHAAEVAAREAGKYPNTPPNLGAAVAAANRVLVAASIAITGTPGSGTRIYVDDAAGSQSFGDAGTSRVPALPLPTGSEVRVTLCVKSTAKKTDGTTPVIRSMNAFTWTLGNRQFQASALVTKE